MINETPQVICPECHKQFTLEETITAQSNQNVIFECPSCGHEKRNIQTSKG
ncbi:hypothetical protein JI666_00650 [Bacillus sp. NTK071]|uniref:hypothetical protein n=1 Tax=Bacillus sp. NTK071 TaxID=2802175 RepID=UPI00146A0C42|nr:hypothetical protein [Bacillus sp. NTK071]MBN8207249.1 hypothetical protein [Bacillus sp. NTK071]